MSHSHPRRLHSAVKRTLLLGIVCLAAGGTAFWLSSGAKTLPQAAASAPASSSASETAPAPSPASSGASETAPALFSAQQAQAMLADPRMVLVNHSRKMPEDYTFTTKECGSDTAINKTLQTEAAEAFLSMQAAAAKDGVDIRMQSGYRSVEYQQKLYDNKTRYYRDKGYPEAEARQKAAAVVNPPGYSEHNCGLAADLNSPEHTTLDTGFADTAAFRWLQEHAVEYGFLLRYPEGAEAVTEITYEPWHWRYVGPENAALLCQSGLCFEDAIALLEQIAAGEAVPGQDPAKTV